MDDAETERALKRKAKKERQKQRKLEEGIASKAAKKQKVSAYLQITPEVFTPGQLSEERPFEADPTDHCETPFEAYADIEPFLFALSKKLGRCAFK